MDYQGIRVNELLAELVRIQGVYGNLPILTYNQNDCSLVYDYIISDSMNVSVREIVTVNDITYIKDKGYDDWFDNNVDEKEGYFVDLISKRHPELSGIAKKILVDEFMDDDWEENWGLIHPIINHYYLNELDWKRVVLLTNES